MSDELAFGGINGAPPVPSEGGSDHVKHAYAIKDPLGRTIEIPQTSADDFAYFTLADKEAIRSYYDSEGYVVVRGLIDPGECDRAHAAFEREVKPSHAFIYRQATANPERHVYTKPGHMLNSILNVQSLDPRLFPGFRKLGTGVVTSAGLQAVLRILFDEPGKLVQSMYFEGNPATWPHQDTYLPRFRAYRRDDGGMVRRRGYQTRRRAFLRLSEIASVRHDQERRRFRHRVQSRAVQGSGQTSHRRARF